MDEEKNEVVTDPEEVTYECVKDAEIERYFAYDLQVDENDFWWDDEDKLMGAVVHFEVYPDHATLVSIFDDLLQKAVMQTQGVDEDEATEMIQDCDDPSEYPQEFDVSNTFSVLFSVEGHRGLYRMLQNSGDYWTCHSSGRKGDRWEI